MSPPPGCSTTVGLPEPVQCRCSLCPPTSTNWPGHRVRACIQVLAHGLEARAHRGKSHHRDHRVDAASRSAAATQLPVGLNGHPDRQRQQRGRPHPAQGIAHPGAERDEEKSGHAHEHRRHHGPSLWLVGEPHREHGQHRPTHGESPQHRAGDVVLLHLDERGGDEKQGGDEPGRQRPGHDPADATRAAGICGRPGGPVRCQRGWWAWWPWNTTPRACGAARAQSSALEARSVILDSTRKAPT